jgi:hypothetical protein
MMLRSRYQGVTVSAPIQIAGPSFTPVSAVATVTTPCGNFTKFGDAHPRQSSSR